MKYVPVLMDSSELNVQYYTIFKWQNMGLKAKMNISNMFFFKPAPFGSCFILCVVKEKSPPAQKHKNFF